MHFFLLLLNLDTVSSKAYLADPLSRLGEQNNPQVYRYSTYGTAGIRYPLSDAFLNTCGTRGTNPGDVQAIYQTGQIPRVKWRMLNGLQGEPETIRVAIKYSDDDNFNDNVIFQGSNDDISGSKCADTEENVVNGLCDGSTVGLRDIGELQMKILTKPCDKCVLQWSWSTSRGYGFVDCADISIEGPVMDDPVNPVNPSIPVFTNPDCNSFCRSMRDTCADEYSSTGACNTACQKQARSILDESVTGNTFECRVYHVNKARDSTGNQRNAECSNAGASGDSMCLPASACDVFCNAFNNVCKDVNGIVPYQEYSGVEKCVESCSSLKQTGLVGAMTGDTLQCREFQVSNASEFERGSIERELACDQAQPKPTRQCIEQYKPCDTFCSSWDKWCGTFVNVTQYINCTTECENILSNGNMGDRSGNTLQCREYQLGVAAMTRQPGSSAVKSACEAAALDGGGVCVGSPPAQPTSNAVKLRIATGLSGAFVAALLVGLF